MCVLFSSAGQVDVFGVRLAGLMWLLPLGISILMALAHLKKVKFYILPWIPWSVYLVMRTDFSNAEAIQRLAILSTPLFVGIAASTAVIVSYRLINKAILWVIVLSILVYVLAVISSGTFSATESTWYLPEGASMTFLFLGLIQAVKYDINKFRKILFAMIVFILFISESRGTLLALMSTVLIAPFGYDLKKRGIMLAILVVIAIFVFKQESFQEVMFREHNKGTSNISNIEISQIKTGGRLTAWPIFLSGISNIWFGQGTAASSTFGQMKFGQGKWAHPHNEYIRVLFDYGIVGFLLLLFPALNLIYCFFTKLKKADQSLKWMIRICIGGVIAILFQGFTGNILLYSAWYGNILFLFIGLTYSALRQKERCILS